MPEILGGIAIAVTIIIYGISDYRSHSPQRLAAKDFSERLKELFSEHARRFLPFKDDPKRSYIAVRHSMGKLLPIVQYNAFQFELWLLHPTKCGETVVRFWIGDETTRMMTLRADGSIFQQRVLDYEAWKMIASSMQRGRGDWDE